MIIYIDIDETICYYEGERDYNLALPIEENIKKINVLIREGHEIIYWTARGTASGKNWRALTERQLKQWGAKHTFLKMGKPYYDIFICDKAINSKDFFNK